MLGKDNVAFEVFRDVKHNVLVGCFPPSWPLPYPPKPPSFFCPCNEAILDTMQPFCTEKNVFSCAPKIVREMNQWSISGIFNYYSACCTETMTAAVSFMADYQKPKLHALHPNWQSVFFMIRCPHCEPERWTQSFKSVSAFLHLKGLVFFHGWDDVKRSRKVQNKTWNPNRMWSTTMQSELSGVRRVWGGYFCPVRHRAMIWHFMPISCD